MTKARRGHDAPQKFTLSPKLWERILQRGDRSTELAKELQQLDRDNQLEINAAMETAGVGPYVPGEWTDITNGVLTRQPKTPDAPSEPVKDNVVPMVKGAKRKAG